LFTPTVGHRHTTARRTPGAVGAHLGQGALGLVLNAIVLWNTRYLDRALNYRTIQGRTVATDDIARLPPLIHDHINLHGRYLFTLAGRAAHGHLRPLNSA
jgi:hypothetical protein